MVGLSPWRNIPDLYVYARNALRMSALMGQRVLYVFTHDSIGLGEDGPTHQPVEQLTALRATPNLHTRRPCDAVESAIVFGGGEVESGPTALVFAADVALQVANAEHVAGVHRGGYVLVSEQGSLDAILIATGSEVALAVEAAARLASEGRVIRVVSLPCAEVFDAQEAGYREAVLPSESWRRSSGGGPYRLLVQVCRAGWPGGWHELLW